MSQLQAILKYQEIDAKLLKLENELSASKERKEYVKLKKFMETAPERLDSMEGKAKALKAEVETVAKQYEELESTLGEFENLDEMIGGGADVSFYKKKVLSIMEKIKKLKADLNVLVTGVKETDAEYQKLKKLVIEVQKQIPEVTEKYKAVKTENDAGRKEVEQQLAKLEKDILPEVLEKYKVKRKEKIFPVVVELTSGRCPYCSMEPPLAAKSKLAEGIECDHCHRIIFG